jgi:hypothetical protein
MIEETRKNHHGLSAVSVNDLPAILNELYNRLLPLLPNEDADLVRALVRALAVHESLSTNDEVKAALSAELSTGDDFGALGDLLNSLGLAEPAKAAFKLAASIDFQDVSLKDALGGPFNGQQYRQTMFQQLLRCIDFSAIVETGSFRGSTTEFMANATTVRIFSCELNERHFHFARRRLASHRNVELHYKDTRAFLREVLASGGLGGGPVFFYLDAHWGSDLPLWDELDIILGHPIEAVVMIDDFRVPGDLGFGYDDYGPGKQLSVAGLRANLTSQPDLFFPFYTSTVETGAKRGAAVLAPHRLSDVINGGVPSLARMDWHQALRLDAAMVETAAA